MTVLQHIIIIIIITNKLIMVVYKSKDCKDTT